MTHLPTVKPLTADDEKALIRAAQAGDRQAADTLVRSQVRWLASQAIKLTRRNHVEADDLVQAGAVALLEVIATADTGDTAARLYSQAKGKVLHAMMEAKAESLYPVTIPNATLRRYQKAVTSTQTENEARDYATDPKRGSQRLDPATFDAIHRVVNARPVDAPVTTDARGRKLTGAYEVSEPDFVDSVVGKAEVDSLLDALDPRSREIVVRTFGLNGGEPEVARVIAQDLGIDRSRVAHILKAALVKMREVAQ